MHIVLSINGYGHHPAAWRVSSLAAEPYRLPRHGDVVKLAETGLLDGVFFVPPLPPDFLASGRVDVVTPDALPTVGTLVAQTARIGLGGSVYVAHTEPFNIARAFSVLDNLSAGRSACILNLKGLAQSEGDFGHAKPLDETERYRRAEEYLEVMMKLWDSWEDDAVLADKAAGLFADSSKIHPINHSGAYFAVRGPLVAIRPVQGHPVLVVDDLSPPGRHIAAACADVVLVPCNTVAAAEVVVKDVRGKAAALGRDPSDLRMLMTISPILADTDTAARERAEQLDQMADRDALGSLAPRFVGSVEAFCDFVAKWSGTGICDGLNILPPVLPDDVGLLVDGVVPLLQQRGLFRAAYSGGTLREHLALKRPPSRFSQRAA